MHCWIGKLTLDPDTTLQLIMRQQSGHWASAWFWQTCSRYRCWSPLIICLHGIEGQDTRITQFQGQNLPFLHFCFTWISQLVCWSHQTYCDNRRHKVKYSAALNINKCDKSASVRIVCPTAMTPWHLRVLGYVTTHVTVWCSWELPTKITICCLISFSCYFLI